MAGVTETDESLASQARYFHQAFFKGELDQEVIDRYIAANRHCFPDIDARSKRLADRVVSERLDVEAVEFVLRRTRHNTIVTKKLNILFYLVEVRSRYFSLFVNEEKRRLRALVSLGLSAAAAVYKLAKGKYLLRKHGLL